MCVCLFRLRTKSGLTTNTPMQGSATDFPGHHPEEDAVFSEDAFRDVSDAFAHPACPAYLLSLTAVILRFLAWGDFAMNHLDQHLQVILTRMSNLALELDMIGLDASVANAIRRVLLAEVRPPHLQSRRELNFLNMCRCQQWRSSTFMSGTIHPSYKTKCYLKGLDSCRWP